MYLHLVVKCAAISTSAKFSSRVQRRLPKKTKQMYRYRIFHTYRVTHRGDTKLFHTQNEHTVCVTSNNNKPLCEKLIKNARWARNPLGAANREESGGQNCFVFILCSIFVLKKADRIVNTLRCKILFLLLFTTQWRHVMGDTVKWSVLRGGEGAEFC